MHQVVALPYNYHNMYYLLLYIQAANDYAEVIMFCECYHHILNKGHVRFNTGLVYVYTVVSTCNKSVNLNMMAASSVLRHTTP